MKLAILLSFFAVFSVRAFAQTETQEFDAASVQSFEISNTSGDVKIRKTEGVKMRVIAHKKKFEKGCVLEMKKAGAKVVVEVEQPFRSTCDVDFEVFVPESADLELKTGSGDIDVNGTRGNIVFRVGSGNVKVEAIAKKIDGRSGAGALEAKGELGNVHLLTGSGNARLVYTKAPAGGEIDIKSGSGDAEVVLPKETKILTDSMIGAGKFYNELGDDKDAQFRISFKAGAGSMKILKAKN